MTEINLEEIVNRPADGISYDEFVAVLDAMRAEDPSVSIDVIQMRPPGDPVADNQAWQADIRMTFDHPEPNVLERQLAGVGRIFRDVRRGVHPDRPAVAAREHLETADFINRLQHVRVAVEDEKKANVIVPNDAAGKALAGHPDKPPYLEKSKAKTHKNHILFRTTLANVEDQAWRADALIAQLKRAQDRVENGDLDANLDNVSVTLGNSVVAVEFPPKDGTLDHIRKIAGARFRRGEKKHDVLDRPHWTVPLARIEELETALPQIEAAVSEADAEAERRRKANHEIAERLQGQHGPIQIAINDDDKSLSVAFPKNREAKYKLKAVCWAQFDPEDKTWQVDIREADALEAALQELQSILEKELEREREREAARQEAARKQAEREARDRTDWERFKAKREVVLANLERPTEDDQAFMQKMAKQAGNGGIARANEVHPYRRLVSAYPDYADAMGLPTDLRNNRALRAYQNGQRDREAREFVEEKYAEFAAEPEGTSATSGA